MAALTADVGLAFTGSGSLDQMLQVCADSMVRNLARRFCGIWTFNEAENVLELRTTHGLYTHIDGQHSRVPVGEFKIGRIAGEKKPHLTNDVATIPASATPNGQSGRAWWPLPGIPCSWKTGLWA